MKLRINAKDHNLIEDDFGNPIFQFLGLHPSDRYEIIKSVNNAEYLRNQLDDTKEDVSDGQLSFIL